MDEFVSAVAERVLAGEHPVKREEALRLAGPQTDIYALLYWANRLRTQFKGKQVRGCAIVSVRTGGCTEDCAFCAQSARHQTGTPAQGFVSRAEVEQAAQAAKSEGAYGLGIVMSGLGPQDSQLPMLQEYLHTIGAAGLQKHASLGVLSEPKVKALKAAGLVCYNHNLETSRRFFPRICTTHSYDDRVNTLKALRQHGIKICSGGLFGMGETWEDRVDLALELRELGSANVPLNFLARIAGTPLEHLTPLAPLEILRIVALYRFMLPQCDIGVYGGREANLRDLQALIFMAGANALMLGNYLTTQGRSAALDRQMVQDLDLELAGCE